jgi:uncharacterized protein YbdZ (MbtH family)
VTDGEAVGQRSGESDLGEQRYQVVMNAEEQYSIWPTDLDLPDGWSCDGTTGSKEQCLEHIEQVWTDMRPLSLRKRMAEDAAAAQSPGGGTGGSEADDQADGPSIVARLSGGNHPVELSLSTSHDLTGLRSAVRQGYLLLRFTGTRGGTELSIRIDPELSDLSALSDEDPRGKIHVAGDVTVDFQPARCRAWIDLPSLTASGHLEPVVPA